MQVVVSKKDLVRILDRCQGVADKKSTMPILGNVLLEVSGRGLIDCELYQQPGRLILHVVNLTSAGTWRAPAHELIPSGPLQVRVRPPQGMRPKTLKMLVSQENKGVIAENGGVQFEIKSVLDHEVVVLES